MPTAATPPADERTPTSRDRVLLLSICALALVWRLLVVWQCAGAGLFSDMQEYYDRARHLVDHGQFHPDAFRPPGYPVFLAAIAATFGEHTLIAARVIQALLGAACVWLTGLLGERLAGPRAGLAAAAILAVYPAWLIYPVYLVAEPLFMFLTLLGLWMWVQGGMWTAILAGLVLSMAMQTRAAGVATIGGLAAASTIALIAVMRQHDAEWKRLAARLGVFLAAFALALAPWVIRNARLFGEFIPTDTASGWNFILGNNPMATGRLELDQVAVVSQTYWSRATTDVQRHRIGLEAGTAFIKDHPVQWMGLALRKIGYLVGLEGREHAWTYSFHFHGRRSYGVVWAWGLALLVSYPLLMIAAAAAMFRPGTLGTPLGATCIAILLCVALVHVGSFGESRFHLPWVPMLAIFASSWWEPRPHPPWGWSRRVAFGALALALVVLWITQLPDLMARLAMLARSTGPIGLPY